MDTEELLKKSIVNGWITTKDKVLVVCGGIYDDQILNKLNFSNYIITSAYKSLPKVKNYKQADAQHLPFKNSTFDICLVNAGLHHCALPHLALTEMYRVAKKAVIVHEAQDSLAVRLMIRLKLIFDFETGSISAGGGGLNNTALPNFVYRWNRREVRKTLNSYDPTRKHEIIFFRSFRYYPFYLNDGEFWADKTAVKFLGRRLSKTVISLIVSVLNLIIKNQGNDLAFIIRKNKSSFQPWMNSKNLISLINKPTL